MNVKVLLSLQRLKNKYIIMITFKAKMSLNDITIYSPFMIKTSIVLVAP